MRRILCGTRNRRGPCGVRPPELQPRPFLPVRPCSTSVPRTIQERMGLVGGHIWVPWSMVFFFFFLTSWIRSGGRSTTPTCPGRRTAFGPHFPPVIRSFFVISPKPRAFEDVPGSSADPVPPVGACFHPPPVPPFPNPSGHCPVDHAPNRPPRRTSTSTRHSSRYAATTSSAGPRGDAFMVPGHCATPRPPRDMDGVSPRCSNPDGSSTVDREAHGNQHGRRHHRNHRVPVEGKGWQRS